MSVAATVGAVRPRIIDRHWFIRLWEIIPGAVSWSVLVLPIALSLTEPILVAYFIVAFDLYWLVKSVRLSINLVRGYTRLHRAKFIDWNARLDWLVDLPAALEQAEDAVDSYALSHPASGKLFRLSKKARDEHKQLHRLQQQKAIIEELAASRNLILDPRDLYNVVILATYNESLDILEPSVQAIAKSSYPLKQLMLVIAYEERGGTDTEANAKLLIERYGHLFAYATAVMHPDGLVGEVKGGGKGPNITYAGRELARYIESQKIDPNNVIVTTFDSDHRASSNYFSYLSYAYATNPNRERKSYQPIPMFYNNIWDAPAPMRVIATGNSFWLLMETMRPHRLRNFAAHAQSLKALIATDFWSITTIVEDGHQFWRTYFVYEGDHEVVPIFTPVYQDAVLADTIPRTFRAQYLQQRRWAWGVSDIQFVVRNAIRHRNIPWSRKLVQIGRLFEGHFSWATAALLITFTAWLPLYLNADFSHELLAHQLPIIASRILQIALIGQIVTVFISMISLPPRPERYRRSRNIGMVMQWVLLPVTSILFGSLAALEAQTRLMFGRYLGFYVTEKAVKK